MTSDIGSPEFLALRRRVDLNGRIRFAALKRLSLERDAITDLINALSFLIAVVSLVALVFAADLSRRQGGAFGAFSIAISIYIIVLNYEFSRRNFDQRITRLKISASTLHEILHRINNSNKNDIDFLEYSRLIDSALVFFTDEHDEIDHNYVLSSRPDLRLRDISEKDAAKHRKKYRRSHHRIIRYLLIFPILSTIVLVVFVIYFD